MSVTSFEQMVTSRTPSVLPLTVEQLHRMVKAGILSDGEPVELIDGMLVRKDRGAAGGSPMVHSPRHAWAVNLLQRLNRHVEPHSCHARCQLPVALSSTQAPEPDAAVLRGNPDAYADHHPRPDEIVATIEVAESSLEYDRTTKQRLYATAGIPQYWIVNLVENQIEVYDQTIPADGRYARRSDFKLGQNLQLAISPSTVVNVPVAELLP